MEPVIAIVGRPNVGKSTLFNRLVGSRQALVHDRPGVTRDRHYGTTEINGRTVTLVDTGGFEPVPSDDLFAKIRQQAIAAIEEAHIILFVVDRQTGMTPADELAADIMRKMNAEDRLLLVVNKCDGPRHEEDAVEFYQLGLGRNDGDALLTISAEHGRGIYELLDAIEALLPPATPAATPTSSSSLRSSDPDSEEEEEDDDALEEDTEEEPEDGEDPEDGEEREELEGSIDGDGEIRVAVIGRPNIGKSTLVNRLLGEERHVVHDMPGTTMDAIDSVFEGEGRTWRLVDTAGVRRRSRIDDVLEGFATGRAIKSIERCHVSLLVIDGEEGITAQDARLAGLIEDRGRCAVILVNRWDLARNNDEMSSKAIQDQIYQGLPHLAWAPVLFISALTGKGCHRILPTILRIYEEFEKRIPTAALNRWLEHTVAAHSPPQQHHHRVRLNYITQTRVRPPTFVIWSNTPDAIHESYQRYLSNQLRTSFGFEGTPLRVQFRRKRRPWDSEEGEG